MQTHMFYMFSRLPEGGYQGHLPHTHSPVQSPLLVAGHNGTDETGGLPSFRRSSQSSQMGQPSYNKEHRLAFLESKPNPGESGVVTADMHVALAVEDTLHP